MIKLHNITLCALGSEKYNDSQKKALEYSSRNIEFGAVMNIIQDCPDINAWNKAIVFDLGSYIKTDFALLVHPDGYVVHPECWNPKWLEYDYIGSPWPLPTDDYSYRDINGKLHRVGNSVSLRSKKLLDLPKKINMEWRAFHGNTNEDGAICVNYRHLFEEAGCKFAPLEEAVFFGRENDIPENMNIDKTFVFHQHWSDRNKMYEVFEKSDHFPLHEGVPQTPSPV